MRGAPSDCPERLEFSGIIPAYAGSTRLRSRRWPRPRDHPRVCGEHLSATTVNGYHQGSSPRMRGARARARRRQARRGIIPAHAGSTCRRNGPLWFVRDHPRVCGEHLETMVATRGSTGSSPRMRGAPSLSVAKTLTSGIIPAHAGSTSPPRWPPMLTRDHPRVCGEHYSMGVKV